VNPDDWKLVATALLGSWPSQVAAWGREALAAYMAELAARGVTSEAALLAIRSCPAEQRFPPSAPELAALARRDPSAPTFEEMLRLWKLARKARPLESRFDNEAHMLSARNDAAMARAFELHPLVGSFVERFGVGRLRMLPLDDPDWGEKRKADLREAWDRHCEAMEGREVAAVAAGRRDGLRAFDPLAVLGAGPLPKELHVELEPRGFE
jgi:hypothetical protein